MTDSNILVLVVRRICGMCLLSRNRRRRRAPALTAAARAALIAAFDTFLDNKNHPRDDRGWFCFAYSLIRATSSARARK